MRDITTSPRPASRLPHIPSGFAAFTMLCVFALSAPLGCTPTPTPCKKGMCLESPAHDGGDGTDNPCTQNTDEGPRCPAISLLNHTHWRKVEAAKDPYIEHKKSGTKCLGGGQKVEDGVLEIDTGLCNYITLEQPLTSEIRAGEVVQFAMFHQELSAPSKGEALVSLSIGGQVIWEKKIPIPSEAAAYQPLWTSTQRIPKDTRLLFHLHNHGANTWKIHSLTTGAP